MHMGRRGRMPIGAMSMRSRTGALNDLEQMSSMISGR